MLNRAASVCVLVLLGLEWMITCYLTEWKTWNGIPFGNDESQ